MALQLKQGGRRARGGRQGIHVERTAKTGASGAGHLALRAIVGGAFTEHRRDLPALHAAHQHRHAARRDLAFPVHGPEIGLVQAIVAGEVGERPLAGDQQAPGRWELLQRATQLGIKLLQLTLIALTVAAVDGGTGWIQLAEGLHQAVHIVLGAPG